MNKKTKVTVKKKKGYNLAASFKTDPIKVKEGVWIEYEGGLMLKIAKAGSTEAKAYAHKLASDEKTNKIKSMHGDETKQIIRRAKRVAAKFILLGWENLLEDDGSGDEVEVPYSVDKALELFVEHNVFFEDVVAFSNDIENYKEEAKAELEGN